jgi:hypothetical protein
MEAMGRLVKQAAPISAHVVSFAAPCCFTSSVTYELSKDPRATRFLNVISLNDAVVPALTFAIEACFMRSYNGVDSPMLDAYVDEVLRICKGGQVPASLLRDKDAVVALLQGFKKEHPELELFPLGFHGFSDSNQAPLRYTDNEDDIRDKFARVEWRRFVIIFNNYRFLSEFSLILHN